MSTQTEVPKTIPGVAEVSELLSVTTINKTALGIGEPLFNWGIRKTAEVAIDRHGFIGKLLSEDGRDDAIEWLSARQRRISDKAKIRGTAVHTAAEQIALGVAPEISEEYRPYVEQHASWLEEFRPRFLLAEAPVYNPTVGYAGTLDGIVVIGDDPRPTVVDYKTTEHPPEKRNRPPYFEAALQLAAYARAELVGVTPERRERQGKRWYAFDPHAPYEPMPEVNLDYGLVIVISPYDCFAVPTRIDDEVWRAFRYARELAVFRLDESPTLFRPPLRPGAST